MAIFAAVASSLAVCLFVSLFVCLLVCLIVRFLVGATASDDDFTFAQPRARNEKESTLLSRYLSLPVPHKRLRRW